MSNTSKEQEKSTHNTSKQEIKGIENQSELYKQVPVNTFKDNIMDWEQVKFPAQFWIDTELAYIESMEAVRKRNIKRSLGRK